MSSSLLFKNHESFLFYYKKNKDSAHLLRSIKIFLYKYKFLFFRMIDYFIWLLAIIMPLLFLPYPEVNDEKIISTFLNSKTYLIENSSELFTVFLDSIIIFLQKSDKPVIPVIVYIGYLYLFSICRSYVKNKFHISYEYSYLEENENEEILKTRDADFWRIINDGKSKEYPKLNKPVKDADRKNDSKLKLYSVVDDSIEYVYKNKELKSEFENIYNKYFDIIDSIDKVNDIIPQLEEKINYLLKNKNDCQYLIDENELSLQDEMEKINLAISNVNESIDNSQKFTKMQLYSAAKVIKNARDNIIASITLGKILGVEDVDNHMTMLSAIIETANRDYKFEFNINK